MKTLCFCLLLLAANLLGGAEPSITKMVFRIMPRNPSSAPVSLGLKTIYVAGERYARIEQEAEPQSADKNLIIVNQPDIWVIDSRKKQGVHMVNRGPDFTVHNPILGPDGPQELFGFEYGREMRFFAEAATKHSIGIQSLAFRDLGFKKIEEAGCDVHEIRSGNYRVVMNIIRAEQIPHSIEIFLDDRSMIQLEYIRYEKGIPFDESLFKPPVGISITDSPGAE